MNHRLLLLPVWLLAACGRVGPSASAPTPSPALAAAPAPVTPGPAESDAGVPIDPTDPTWGSRTAPVTIVEFADFQCPFCARAEPTLALIRQTYGPDKVRIV